MLQIRFAPLLAQERGGFACLSRNCDVCGSKDSLSLNRCWMARAAKQTVRLSGKQLERTHVRCYTIWVHDPNAGGKIERIPVNPIECSRLKDSPSPQPSSAGRGRIVRRSKGHFPGTEINLTGFGARQAARLSPSCQHPRSSSFCFPCRT